MLSKSLSMALLFVILASVAYGCSATNGTSLSEAEVGSLAYASAASVCNNLALGKETNASASLAGFPSSQAVDGNFDTIWNSGNYVPGWIEINLGAVYSIDEIRLYVAQYPNGNTTHEIWIADSSKVYTQVDTISGFTSGGQVLDRTYSPSLNSVQWIKVMTTSGPSWVAWVEIQVCQTPSGTSTATSTSTSTATETATSTSTSTSTETQTSTPTSTSTGTQTSTPTFTATSTPTNQVTETPTPTSTATGESTSTPTSTPTGTATGTLTSTPTSTLTSTPTLNTPGKITGGGNLGEKATFGLTVNYDQGDSSPKGNLTYIDHRTGMRVDSTSLNTLVIEADSAWFTGTAMVNGGQEVQFKVEIRDINKTGSTDWFKITIADMNYELGGSMTGGNVTIH